MKSTATFTWDELLTISNGQPVSHHRGFDQACIETDTRTLDEHCFFLPLSGANFNGNTFVERAYETQAIGAFVATDFLDEHPDLKRFPNLIAVADPGITYLKLAQYHRRRCMAKIIAITGSSGKTTTKEMLYAMLSPLQKTQKTDKNYNNEVGVPQTLLELEPDTDVMIVEMGMRGLNQIELLSRYTEPDACIISNVGPAHIGLLGSLETIAQAKCEIFAGMNSDTGIGIINGDDPLLIDTANTVWGGQLETFSLHEPSELKTQSGSISFQFEDIEFTIGLPGKHNVMNALSCIKACQWLGLPLRKLSSSLESMGAGTGRWEKLPVDGYTNMWVINDAYNANPSSLKAALGTFMDTPNPDKLTKIAVIAPMAELGDQSAYYHSDVGQWLEKRHKLDALILLGNETKPLQDAILSDTLPTHLVQSTAEVASLLRKQWPEHVLIFLKGSREHQLESIIDLLKAQSSHALP